MALRVIPQNKKLYTLMYVLGIGPEGKAELVWNYTGQRTIHSSEMDETECQALIDHLQIRVDKVRKKENDAAQKMRRKILSICHEMGWEDQKGKVDFDRLDKWLKKYGHKHYPQLNDYSLEELPALVTQFENLLKSKYGRKSN